MLRFDFNKIIRHKLPARMEKEGVFVHKEALNETEYLEKLKLKLLEEAEEVLSATELGEIHRELADILEVIHAIAEATDQTIAGIESERLKKREANGYFSSDNYVHYIEVPKENQAIIDYLQDRKRPYKFSDFK